MNLQGLIEPYPWGKQRVGLSPVEDSLTHTCSHCGKDFDTHLSYVFDSGVIAEPCLVEFLDGDTIRAEKVHQMAMSLRNQEGDLVSPNSLLGPEADRVISFAVDSLGSKPESELTPEERGWVLLCRFPTIRSIHAPFLMDAWGAWLTYKEPDSEQVLVGNHLGELGERLELHVKVGRISGPFSGEYGDSYLCVMETQIPSNPGELVCWWTGENLYFDEGQEYHIKGTVKKHDEYGGRKQTHLTRVKEVKK